MSLHFGRRRTPGLQLLSTGILLIGSISLLHAETDADTDATKAYSLDPVLVTAQALHGPQSAPSQG
jgi:hypothetical protein